MSQPSRNLLRIIGRVRISAIHGSVFPGATRHQDRQYQRRIEQLITERVKRTQQAKAS